MKVLYLYSQAEKNMETSGEAKKMFMQLNGLKQNGLETDYYVIDRSQTINKLLIRIPFFNIHNRDFRRKFIEKAKDVDAVYLRKNIFDISYLKLLKELRRAYPYLKIIIEIPTYPYDFEWKNWKDFPLLLKDRLNRNKLKKYVDRFVVFSKDNMVFGVPTILTSNGIDCNSVKKRSPKEIDNYNINLLGVAGVERWHGYDRLIKGIKEYYDKVGNDVNLVFHIVGKGRESNNLEKLVADLSMQDHVLFHGFMHGTKLDEMFNRCDIGVGSLGMYRIGMYEGYTLKLREYMARGIPFFYAYDDELIEKNGYFYFIKFPNDDTPIDVQKIIDFSKKLSKENSKIIAEKMNAYAEQELSWKHQMQPVADYIING